MPRTHGDGFIHINKIHSLVYHESELPEVDYSAKVSLIAAKVGKNVASIIEDGRNTSNGNWHHTGPGAQKFIQP
jgi:hypothetical protein